VSAHWHVGMEVECIDAEFLWNNSPLEIGRIYLIERIMISEGWFKGAWSNDPELILRGVVNSAGGSNHEGFCAARFRPVQTRKTDISAFKAILLNPHIPVREDA
jgi:hypothetical protein